jgi:hypothetical protein
VFLFFDCCIARIALPSRRDLLYAEPHSFCAAAEKNLFADGDFCVVEKAGKEMDGA